MAGAPPRRGVRGAVPTALPIRQCQSVRRLIVFTNPSALVNLMPTKRRQRVPILRIGAPQPFSHCLLREVSLAYIKILEHTMQLLACLYFCD